MTEKHPLKPFLPKGAKILMLGSFPPPMKRWKMPFYYPNFQNDMWRIFGIVFFNDLNHFIDTDKKTFKQDEIVDFLTINGVAIYDTAVEVERANNDASDANLDILERVNLNEILSQIPDCKAIVSTGGKSAEVVSEILGVKSPEIGSFVETEFCNRKIRFYRMPSSSRAYPMKVDKKAEIYSVLKTILNH
jgi:G:T/U-mismatch repair DNA glycosylase